MKKLVNRAHLHYLQAPKVSLQNISIFFQKPEKVASALFSQ